MVGKAQPPREQGGGFGAAGVWVAARMGLHTCCGHTVEPRVKGGVIPRRQQHRLKEAAGTRPWGSTRSPGLRFLWRARPGWTQGGGRFERALIFYRQVIHSRVWMGKGSSNIDSVTERLESFLSGVKNILSSLPIGGLTAPYFLPPARGCPLLIAFNPYSFSSTSSC